MTHHPAKPVENPETDSRSEILNLRLERFIDAYRQQGYRVADLDPVNAAPRPPLPALDPASYGLGADDALPRGGAGLLADLYTGLPHVAALAQRLRDLYSGPLALDSSALRDDGRRQWLYQRMEAEAARPAPAERLALLRRLADAQAWEQLVRERFPQAKRFSLEGCESLLPLMDALAESAAGHGLSELLLGMPHRGRLNLLVNLLGCPPQQLLAYFDPASTAPVHDLVYHLGGRAHRATAQGPLTLRLAHNPSHLQSVQPVVAGMTRARRDAGVAAAAILIHGDAAFAGQGVVMESLNLTQKPGYQVGGIVHVIVNNQIGFTTPNPLDLGAPSSCTDVARLVDAPVLHVNADHPEQVLRAARIAFDYRAAFGVDIVIDLLGYRRLGHAEQDIAELTQPQQQERIDWHPGVVARYGAVLRADGLLGAPELAALQAQALAAFDAPASSDFQAFDEAPPPAAPLPAPTPAQLREQLVALSTPPAGFLPHDKLRQQNARWQAHLLAEDLPTDWCLAENLAYASLLQAGRGLRLSGMDVGRGTFMHRHAVWHDQGDAARSWMPLQALARGGARADVVNSPLSEEAVLGFEYGYSLHGAQRLVLWEAQYGDFANGAQIMIDQYLASGEAKWGYRSALAVLLPHGHEGSGPEHSNGYLGRFLQLCAEDNLRVVMPSDSAQWYHLLRQQATAATPKPLIVMSPKGQLYGNPRSHAPLTALLHGRFEPVRADPRPAPAVQQATRAVLCSGKLFYELQALREELGLAEVALLRLEQLYPFPADALAAALAPLGGLRELVWAQEEDRNQGAWLQLREALEAALPDGVRLRAVCRRATAAGSRSSLREHRQEQRALLEQALSGSCELS
ncbi:MAG: 2-oxoglutarate dehydrogenase E1 component [Burkholderiaceae bacterium]